MVTTLPDDFLLKAGLKRSVRVASGEQGPMPLSSLLDWRAVVLLGDPGLGKSQSLRAAAAASGGNYRTVRGFLAGGGAGSRHGGPLFLDGLDETMTTRGDSTPLDDVTSSLRSMGFPPFWLSCRPSDWVRAGGRALLEECIPEGLAIARLLPLSGDQIEAVIVARGMDPDAVVRSLEEANLASLLGNPETLRLTLEVFGQGGPPTSRTDLYRRATAQMARETNRAHVLATDRPVRDKVLAVAGAICATCLLSGRPEIAVFDSDPAGVAVPAEALATFASTGDVRAALGSRLFRQTGDESWEPAHRTIAEFLGASFLADGISRSGRPLGMTLSLLCGTETAPEPSLRGLFAWLVNRRGIGTPLAG